MDVTEALCNNLCKSGIDASISPEKKSLLSQLKPFGAKSIAKITIRGRQVAGIELFGHYQSPNEKRFGAGARSTLEAVDIDYILRGDIKGKKKLLEAKLDVKRTGLVHRKVVEMRWEGGTLASKLNSDSTVTELLWQSLGKLSARDIEVNLDEDGGTAIIHVRDDRHVLSHKLPPFQLYERIAEHIYALTGTQKAVQPLSPPESVAVEAAPKPPENKYCLKCGEPVPLDSSFCPICGATIEAMTPPDPPPGQPEPPVVSHSPKAVVAEPVPPPKPPEPPVVSPPPKATLPLAPASKQRKASKATASPKAVVTKPAPAPKPPEPPVAIPPMKAVKVSMAGGIACKKCGRVNPTGTKLCRWCSNKLEAIPPSAPVPKQPESSTAVPSPPASLPCGKCGHQNDSAANFCARCGAKIEIVSRSRLCPKCGDPVAEDENFCDKCGKKLV